MLSLLPACLYGLAFITSKINKIKKKLIKKKEKIELSNLYNPKLILDTESIPKEKLLTKKEPPLLTKEKSPLTKEKHLPTKEKPPTKEKHPTKEKNTSSYNKVTSKHPKTEQECRTILEDMYGLPFPPNEQFVKNPRTGRWLTLDGYNPDIKIAFEYQGQQHYEYPNYFSKQNKMTKEQFKQAVFRDIYKKKACEAAGIKLIIIPYNKRNQLNRYIRKVSPLPFG